MQKNEYEEKINYLRQHLEKYIQKRLQSRIQQKLRKHFTNCKFSNCLNRFYVCSNKQNLKKDSYVICSQQKCNNCQLYSQKYTIKDKQQIVNQFYQDINNPSICGNKEPKIAALIWVVKLFGENKKQEKTSIWKKIKNGFALK